MIQLFGLAIFTKKEVMQLLIDEKRASYRKGYKAGAAMKYRYTPKPIVTDEPTLVDDLLTLSRTGSLPSVYGDSLPVKQPAGILDVEKVMTNGSLTVHIGDVGPVETGTVTDNLHYT
jgi:hypothetical protein